MCIITIILKGILKWATASELFHYRLYYETSSFVQMVGLGTVSCYTLKHFKEMLHVDAACGMQLINIENSLD